MDKTGLFIGISTLDCIYLTEKMPKENQKIVALDQTISGGGPATNAAVTFSYLGNKSNLLTIIGNNPIGSLIKSDLANYSLKLIDITPERKETPAVSAIVVTKATGNRAVISINTTKFKATIEQIPQNILQGIDIILIDGHQMTISQEIARLAREQNIPVAIDGGSWKKDFDKVLPYVDYAVCSADFYPPNCSDREQVFNYLKKFDIPNIAITNGDKAIEYLSRGERGKIAIESIENVVDTLGAGDIFHGAFCHYILQHNFKQALTEAAKIASKSCQFFGTRKWMEK
ncbi:MAG: sugar kinase [Prochloraceae cyanobacterium]